MTEALINRFRPTTFAEVVGHDKIVKALEHAVEKGTARAFLFTGNPGTGKTTLARIVAGAVGCDPGDLIEIDAATHTGIDAMREITDRLMHRPVGGGVKAVIIDEAHALSKQAMQSLLKILEEPPDWVYWFLCTTEVLRNKAIVTRCMQCDLKPVPNQVLEDWLFGLIEDNKLMTAKGWEDIAGVCVDGAMGSPRQALSNLALCLTAKTKKEAQELISSAVDSPEAFELARALVQRQSWAKVQGLLKGLKDHNPESVRHVVRAYATTMALGVNREPDVGNALEVLDAFSQFFPSTDGISPVVLACGKVLLAEKE